MLPQRRLEVVEVEIGQWRGGFEEWRWQRIEANINNFILDLFLLNEQTFQNIGSYAVKIMSLHF